MLEKYEDILARVRGDGEYHSIKSLVQPGDAEVMAVAAILSGSANFVSACQDFVDSFTTYRREVGDYWTTPEEIMAAACPVCRSYEMALEDERLNIYRCLSCGYQGEPARAGDCDDKAILLTSLLRYQLPPEAVCCAFGLHRLNGDTEGHMWVITEHDGGDRIVEATAPAAAALKGNYQLMAFFNDKYAYASPEGIREFNLKPVKEKVYAEI